MRNNLYTIRDRQTGGSPELIRLYCRLVSSDLSPFFNPFNFLLMLTSKSETTLAPVLHMEEFMSYVDTFGPATIAEELLWCLEQLLLCPEQPLERSETLNVASLWILYRELNRLSRAV